RRQRIAPARRFLTRHDCASAQMEGIWRRSACHQNSEVVQTPQQRGNVAAAYLSADLLPVMSVASRSALLALLKRGASLTVRERECNGSITRDPPFAHGRQFRCPFPFIDRRDLNPRHSASLRGRG